MAKTFQELREFLFIKPLALLIISILLLVLRNTDPMLNPIIYTEDGLWSGMAMTHGWMHTLYYAKDGYLVWGNLIALWFADISSQVFCDDRLSCLPESITFISYIFFSFVAALSFFATKSYLHISSRILFFLLVIFIPLGNSSNEIFGRLSNIGYYFVFISLILIILRDTQISTTSKFLIDVTLIISMTTNPVCIPLLFFYLVSSNLILTKAARFNFAKENMVLIFGFLIILFIVAEKKMTAHNSAITGQLKTDNLIEVIFARSILYPFAFPFYTSLNNLITICLFIFWSSFIGFGFFISNRETRRILFISIASLLLYLALTILMRQSLTEQLNKYSVTFPDRYFMGLNVIVIFVTIVSLNSLINSRYKMLSYLIFFFIISLYVINFRFIVEYKSPKLSIAMDEKLKNQVCLNTGKNWLDKSPSVFIITSAPWSIEVPAKIIQKSALKLKCQDVFDEFYISDVSWTSGLLKTAPTFFVFNSSLTREIFGKGKRIRLANGELREILSTSQHGRYLHVHLDRELLNLKVHGRPNNYEVNR